MAEVFTIAGAPSFGAVACPPGWTATPNGNCGGSPPTYRHPAATALQNALKVIARATGDTSLDVRNDGIIGPKTTGAVNKAFTSHIGPGQAPDNFRTGSLSIGNVAQHAAALAQALNAESARRGAVGPPGPDVDVVAPTPADVVAQTSPGVMWALVGVNLVAAGVGAYLWTSRDA